MEAALFTRDDYMKLPEGFPAQLIDGELVREPAPTYNHQRTVGRLYLVLCRLVGDDLFSDFVHPNLLAHQLIAQRIAEELRDHGIPIAAERWRDTGDYVDPDPAEVLREGPGLALQEARNLLVVCWLTRRRDCFDSTMAELLSIDPQDEVARGLEGRFD